MVPMQPGTTVEKVCVQLLCLKQYYKLLFSYHVGHMEKYNINRKLSFHAEASKLQTETSIQEVEAKETLAWLIIRVPRHLDPIVSNRICVWVGFASQRD